jgi:subtilase family serine protease
MLLLDGVMTLHTKLFFKTLLAALFFCLLAANAPAQKPSIPQRITQAIDEAQLARLPGNVHPLARPEFDNGSLADSQPVNHMMLLLQRSPEQETALQQLMEEQQRAGSPNFHAWLTPGQFGKQYGPADADIQAVTDWLTRQGFSIGKVSPGRTIIEFSGNVAQVRNAFHTEMHRFAVNNEEHFANVSDPQIPAALRPVVAGVVSLHNFRKEPFLHHIGKFRRNLKTGEVQPLFTFSDINGTFYAMGPADFAKIYNIPSQYTGSGQSIAIVGRSNINIQDVADFRSIFGLQPPDASNVKVILNGPDPGLVSGDEGESDLDVEWAGAVAPAAQIILVATQSTQTDLVDGIDASSLYIVDNNIAGVMSISYGSCEAGLAASGNAFENALWQQAAAQGITVVVAAGDNGAAGCDDPNKVTAATKGIAVSGTASTPYNVAIGGTDFDDSGIQSTYWNLPVPPAVTTPPAQASAKGYIPEIPWNDSCASTGPTGCDSVTSTSKSLNIVAGSGGPSSVYTKPSWQNVQGVPADGVRDLPDVSLFASDGHNRSFYITCQSDQNIPGDTGCNLAKFVTTTPFHDFQAIGGTSAGAPTFAGIIALVNQKTSQRQGNANYALYALARAETFSSCNSASLTLPNTCVFNDIATKGNNAVPCPGASLNCSKTTSGGFGVLVSGGNPAFSATTGYDLATGLGSVNVTNLIANWVTPPLIGTTTTLSASPSPVTITVDASVTFSGSVTKSSGSGTATPSGVVVIENASTGQAIDRFTLQSGSSSYSIPTTLLPGGSYNVIAHYGGDGTFGPSDSAPVSVTSAKQNSNVVVSFVTFNGTTPVLSTSAQTIQYGSPYILRVDVENAAGTPCQNFTTLAIAFICPTGTISLLDNGVALNDFPNATNVAKLNDRGFAEDQPIQLNAGSHPITATYSGDNSYNLQAASNTLALTITQATTTLAVTSSLSSITSGGSVTLTALVSSTSNSSAGPSGTVQFKNGSTNLSTPATCTPVGFDAVKNVGAHCTATLTTALSALYPPASPGPRTPYVPVIPTVLLAFSMLLFLLLLRAMPAAKRRAYACACLFCLALLAAGIAGCGGGGSGPPPPPPNRTLTISATYSGDTNYAASSGSTTITVH